MRRRARPGRLVLVATLSFACTAPSPDGPAVPAERVPARVVEVIDGDTIAVVGDAGEIRVRLIGVDTPEVSGPFTESECFGRAASTYARRGLEGRDVVLEFDVERTDRFGRTLAYVWLDGRMFNERLVEDGYGVVATFPPNVRYVDRFVAAERRARRDGVGLWSACRVA